MTGLLEPTVRELSFGWAHDRSIRSFSRLRKSPAGLAFKATEKLDPDVRELLSAHCSWCVLDCGEAQMSKACNIAQTAICGSWILVSTLTTGGSARRNFRSDDQAQQDQHSGNFCGLLCLFKIGGLSEGICRSAGHDSGDRRIHGNTGDSAGQSRGTRAAERAAEC